MTKTHMAIHNQKIIATGNIEELVRQVKKFDANIEPIVIEEENCKQINFDWHGSAQTVLGSLAEVPPKSIGKRGRPKLGVVSKEVTLLPRHWEWLATQRGGASVTLRKLVEAARKNAPIGDIICMKQQQLDGFILLFLGDEPGFEEASRSLYRNNKVGFDDAIAEWPTEFKSFILNKFLEIADLHNGISPKKE